MPYSAGSRSMDRTHRSTIHAYCRVDRCGESCFLLGKRESFCRRPAFSIQAATAARVGSVISNWTGRRVLRWSTMARCKTLCPCVTSLTRRAIRSQPRSLLSIARSKSARSRTRDASCRRMRMAQTSCSLKGRFWPTILPLFQGAEEE